MIFELDVKESNRIIVNVNSRWQYMYKPKKGEINMIKLKKDNEVPSDYLANKLDEILIKIEK